LKKNNIFLSLPRYTFKQEKQNNMAKVAKLITFSLTTRIVVDENATEEEMIAASYSKIQDKIDNRELGDNLVEVEDDEEMPFGTANDDVYYQPKIDENGCIVGHENDSIFSFEVYRSKENLMQDFPNCTPIEYSGDDIEDYTFVD
jgi:hypothetical protein